MNKLTDTNNQDLSIALDKITGYLSSYGLQFVLESVINIVDKSIINSNVTDDYLYEVKYNLTRALEAYKNGCDNEG